MMLTEICRHIKNYFPKEIIKGSFVIENGLLSASKDFGDGDLYLIQGSRRNDGVHVHPALCLSDEEFEGRVIKMSPPADFLKLCGEIEEWQQKNGSFNSPFISESFGGYSYKRQESGGVAATWRAVFKDRLNDFRKTNPFIGE